MYRSLVRIIPQMPFCRYAVTTMGAEIYDTHKNERIYSVPLEPENARAVVEYGLKNNLHINIYINNVLYTNSLDKFSDFYLRTTDAPSTLIEGDVLEFIKDKVISKILYITEVEDAPAIQKECIHDVNTYIMRRLFQWCNLLLHMSLNYLTDGDCVTKAINIVFKSGNTTGCVFMFNPNSLNIGL